MLLACGQISRSSHSPARLSSLLAHRRCMHDRNKRGMEFVAKGWSSLKEYDRVVDECYDLKHPRLVGLLRAARENFELALEADNMNTHARYWLGKMHMDYEFSTSSQRVGAALLVEAANMGDANAQYELGWRLRVKTDNAEADLESYPKALHYLERAVEQLHPDALYLLGSIYMGGDCVEQDIASAMWCFHRASERGHAGAAIAYGSLLLKGFVVPDAITRFNAGRSPSTGMMRRRGKGSKQQDLVQLAKEKFQIAAEAGSDLGFRWLERLAEYENLKADELQELLPGNQLRS